MSLLKSTLVALLLTTVTASAQNQKIPLINSGEVIGQGIVLYDSGEYEAAIKLFKTVPPRDTNYVYMLSELAIAYDANKQYDEVIKVCEEGLKNPSSHRAHLMRSLGTAYDHKGDFEQSIIAYKKGIRDYPFDYSLHYNLGITYYNHKDYDKAIECFFTALHINPFHTGSHFNLGRISALQGKKVHAMLSLGVYMSINSSDNERLVYLERFLNNEMPDENSIPYNGSYPFERLDQIIRARIVTEKNFKAKVPVNAILTRQYQLFLDQLSLAENAPDDPWIEFYMPLYKDIQSRDMLEPFLYHILTSTKFEDAAKWRKKNDKKLDEFFALANEKLKANRTPKTLTAEWGFKNPVPFWYSDDNKLEAIGHEDAKGNRTGKWKYFSTSGECIADGEYDAQGNKTGIWKYYYDNGLIKSIKNSETGELHSFTEQGEPLYHYFMKGDNIEGDVEIFYPCGVLKEKLLYKDGKRNGAGKTFYADGKIESEYTYKADNAEGTSVDYYQNGQVKSRVLYKEGKLHGDFTNYHANGKVKTTGSYKDGKANGIWKYYYANGVLEKTGPYKDDLIAGEWVFYDVRGTLAEKKSVDDKGELHGEDVIYHNGKLHFKNFYDHGLLTGIAYYDKNGKELSKNTHPQGTFKATGYYPEGQVRFEGDYKKGKANGEWKYYYREGGIESVSFFKDDQLHGASTAYFKSGPVKSEKVFENDELHGYWTEYYNNGKVKEEGWYQNGLRQQQWLSYYADGTLETDSYYLNGNLSGTSFDYNIDGKKYSVSNYREGKFLDLHYYDPAGNIRMEKEFKKAQETVIQKYQNGKDHSRIDVTCGDYTNISKWWPNGTPYLLNDLLGGRRHGNYRFLYSNGKTEMEGNYLEGNEAGKWTWYDDMGRKRNEGYYLDGEADSTWTYFNEDGKISSTILYQSGERHGVTTIYSPDGTAIIERLYDNGDIVAYRTLTADNKLGDWINFTGNETISSKYPDGTLAYEESYKKGILEGPQKMYYRNGKLYQQYLFAKGDNTGEYVEYYENGKLKEKGAYVLDQLDGPVEYYNSDGSLRFVETYKLGVIQGKTILYQKGTKVNETEFWAGVIVE